MAQPLKNSQRAAGSLIDPMLIQIITLFPNKRVFINIRSKYSYFCSLLLNLANLTEAGISGNDKHELPIFYAKRPPKLVFHPPTCENWFAREIKNLNY